MKNILILVDVQNGFIMHECTAKLVPRIEKLLQSQVFDYIVATKFLNFDNSIYEKLFNWYELKNEQDRGLFQTIEEYAEVIIEKTIYTCVNPNFLQRLCQLNDGVFPEKVFVAGIDTDCCVLKAAVDLFENNIRPIVLTHYCGSNGGQDSHNAGILCLKRLIGDKQLQSGEIICKEDLQII